MRKRHSGPARRSADPINAGLEIFGDAWSLLIVRDLMFNGMSRFAEFRAAGEGMATNVLADRLRKLEAAGIVTRRRGLADARRIEYALTEKGADLAPVLIELTIWAARYEKTSATPAELREMSGDRAGFIARTRRALDSPSGHRD